MQAATYLDQRGPLAIAHRGGTEAAPENTLAAFASAVSVGYRYLETDVHVTSDGVVVAFHDDELDRVTNGVGRIGGISSTLIGGALILIQPSPFIFLAFIALMLVIAWEKRFFRQKSAALAGAKDTA